MMLTAKMDAAHQIDIKKCQIPEPDAKIQENCPEKLTPKIRLPDPSWGDTIGGSYRTGAMISDGWIDERNKENETKIVGRDNASGSLAASLPLLPCPIPASTNWCGCFTYKVMYA